MKLCCCMSVWEFTCMFAIEAEQTEAQTDDQMLQSGKTTALQQRIWTWQEAQEKESLSRAADLSSPLISKCPHLCRRRSKRGKDLRNSPMEPRAVTART